MSPFVHLPPTGTDPHRWVNPEAVEWFAAMGTESVIRLRTGDTLRTSLSVTALADRLAGVPAPSVDGSWYMMRMGADLQPHDQIEHPPGM